jgi:hypothetical protein
MSPLLHRHFKVSVPLYHRLVFNAFLDQPSATGGAKRKRTSENIIRSSKKIKVDQALPSLTPRAPEDVQCAFYGIQCAFYGIERLRYSMDITHSMSVLLSGKELSSSALFSHADGRR